MTTARTVPERYRDAVVAHIMVEKAALAIEFYRQAFGAAELFRIAAPDGRIVRAEIVISGCLVMVGDAELPFAAPEASGPTHAGLHVYLDDVGAAVCEPHAREPRSFRPHKTCSTATAPRCCATPSGMSGSS